MSETATFIDMLKTVEFVSCFAFVFGSVVSLSILTFSVLHFKKRLKQFQLEFEVKRLLTEHYNNQGGSK